MLVRRGGSAPESCRTQQGQGVRSGRWSQHARPFSPCSTLQNHLRSLPPGGGRQPHGTLGTNAVQQEITRGGRTGGPAGREGRPAEVSRHTRSRFVRSRCPRSDAVPFTLWVQDGEPEREVRARDSGRRRFRRRLRPAGRCVGRGLPQLQLRPGPGAGRAVLAGARSVPATRPALRRRSLGGRSGGRGLFSRATSTASFSGTPAAFRAATSAVNAARACWRRTRLSMPTPPVRRS